MEPYQHRRLHLLNGIRVFDLHGGHQDSPVSGSLREVELPDDAEAAPEYTALSYTWGSPNDMSLSPIWIDGKPMKVRNNLMSALRALRHEQDDRTYWIDAICINQADVAEKNHQVASMAKIYRAAEAVKIWLGIDDDSSPAAIAYVRDVGRMAHGNSAMPQPEVSPPTSAMHDLMRRDYWFRAWIVQEVILAHEIDVHCGSAVMAWDMLVRTCLPLQTSLPDSPSIQLMVRREAALQDDQLLQDQTLESLIRAHSRCECSDRRDRVFALLSLASDCAFGQGIQADYRMSRLELLVCVLEFCRPEDPVEFVSLLFQALSEPDGDSHWQRAKEHWVQNQESAKSTDTGLVSTIHVTQFLAISSATRDWVRHTTVEAHLNPETQVPSSSAMPDFRAALAHYRASGTALQTYANAVHDIDSHNIVVIVGPHHLAIFSVDPLKAVASPCKRLGLHDRFDDCTWALCAGQANDLRGS